TRGRIVEDPAPGIPEARLADRVGVEHPAVAEAREGRVHLAREDGQLLGARRVHVGPAVRPAGEKGPVFQQTDALADQRGVVQKIGQALGIPGRQTEHQSTTEGKTYPGGAWTAARAG